MRHPIPALIILTTLSLPATLLLVQGCEGEPKCATLHPHRFLTLQVGPPACVFRDVTELDDFLRGQATPEPGLVGQGVHLDMRYGFRRKGRNYAINLSLSRFGGFHLSRGLRRTPEPEAPRITGLTVDITAGGTRIHHSSRGTLRRGDWTLGWLTDLALSATYTLRKQTDSALTYPWPGLFSF